MKPARDRLHMPTLRFVRKRLHVLIRDLEQHETRANPGGNYREISALEWAGRELETWIKRAKTKAARGAFRCTFCGESSEHGAPDCPKNPGRGA